MQEDLQKKCREQAILLYRDGLRSLEVDGFFNLPERGNEKNPDYERAESERAEKFFRYAAEFGNSDAQVALAFLLIDRSNSQIGDAALKFISEAISWFQKAIDQGHTHAMVSLAWIHRESHDFEGYVERDLPLSVQLLQLAANAGYLEGQYWLGAHYDSEPKTDENIREACYWFRKAAEQGHEDAPHWLACLLVKERGWRFLPSKEDGIRDAIKWFEVANDFGALGAMHLSNRWGIQDFSLAGEWFGRGADEGCPASACFLGYMHEHGIGFPKNFDVAKEYYGLKPLVDPVIDLFRSLANKPEPPDPFPQWFRNFLSTLAWCRENDQVGFLVDEYLYWNKRIAPYLERLEQEGDPGKLKGLGDQYFFGQAFERDWFHARELYIRAMEGGNNSASSRVDQIDDHRQATAEMSIDDLLTKEVEYLLLTRSHIEAFCDWQQKTSLRVGDLTKVTSLECAVITWSRTGKDGSRVLKELLAKHGLSFVSVSDDEQLERLRDMKLLATNIPRLTNGLPDIPKLLTQPVKSLPFRDASSAVRLEDAGISTIADLVKHSETGLQKLPNIGRKALGEIRYALSICGLTLDTDGNKSSSG